MASSYNELFGLGSHSEDASVYGIWNLQDDAANNTIVDSSSTGDDGGWANGNTSVDSTTGPNSYLVKALAFDGSSDRVGGISPTFSSSALTMAAWFRDSSGNRGDMVSFNAGSSTFNYGRLSVNEASSNAGTTAGGFRLNSASYEASAITADQNFDDGFWHFSVARKNGNTVTVRTDATYTASDTASSGGSEFNLTELAIGCLKRGLSTALFFGGDMAGVALFSRVLTDDESDELYNGPEPVNSVAPAVSGTETQGQTLSCTTGTWGLDSPFSSGSNGTITYAYQWTRSDNASGLNEADIAGATSSTYTLTASDVGKYIRCRVRASNDGGFDSAADTNSNFTGAIAGGGADYTLTADTQSFVLTGISSGLSATRKLPATVGSFVVDGKAINREAGRFNVVRSVNLNALYSLSGWASFRHFADVDSDGNIEGVFALRSADFVCLRADGTEVWRRTSNATSDKAAYYPKITRDGTALVYGHRGSGTVYCVELDDGTQRWSHSHANVVSMEVCDAGVIVGSSTSVDILNPTTGNSVGGGWPLATSQHEQLLVAGILGGEEVVAINDNSGNISVRRTADATEVFSISSNHSHVDSSFFCDLYNTGSNVYVTVIDDDNSTSGEGDEIVVYNAAGTQLDKYILPAGAPALAVAKFRNDRAGLQIVYGLETGNEIGMLALDASNNLVELWSTSIPTENATATALGQIAVGDFDGDGELEFAVNLGELNGASDGYAQNGILIYDKHGSLKGGALNGFGWDFDPRHDLSNGDPNSTRSADWNGDGKDELILSRCGADGSISEIVDSLNLSCDYASNLRDGLMSYWALDEASGDRSEQISGRTLTEPGAAVGSETGLLGTAASFDQTLGQHLANGLTPWAGSPNRSWSAYGWFHSDESNAAITRGLLSSGKNTAERKWRVDTYNGTVRFFLFNDSGAAIATASKAYAIAAGQTFFVGVYYDAINDEIGLIVDDQSATTASVSGTVAKNGSRFVVGSFEPESGGDYSLDGWAGPVAVWSRRLSSREIARLYNSGSGITLSAFGPSYDLAAAVAAFSFNGISTTLSFTRKLACETGALLLTGNNANLAYGNTLVAELGSFTLTGVDTRLKASRKLVCAAGTFTLTGNDAGLLYDPGDNTYSLSCAAGSFTLTGIAAGLTTARKLPASLGTFALTGIDTGLSFNRVIVLSVGSYTLTGIDAGLSRPKRAFDAEKGAFTLTGVAASFVYSGTPTATFIKVQSATIGVPKATGYITA